jgi:hypothetical protein
MVDCMIRKARDTKRKKRNRKRKGQKMRKGVGEIEI